MWMRVDDKLHSHRKTRKATKVPGKRRDAAAMGLWVLAGSWCADNGQDGWAPADVLEGFDDEWESLAARLIAAGLWTPEDRDGELGYRFNDWAGWNPTGPAERGSYGSHVRWHVNKGVVAPDCEHCPKEPDAPEAMATVAPQSPANSQLLPSYPESETPSEIANDSYALAPQSLTHTHTQLQTATQSAQTLVAEWIEHCATRPPQRVIGHVSKELKLLLDEGQPYDDVRAGLAAWARKGLHPSTLASVVHETRTPKAAKSRNGIDWQATLADAMETDRRNAS